MKKIIKENIDIIIFSFILIMIEIMFRSYIGIVISKQPLAYDLVYIILFDGLLILINLKIRKIIEAIIIFIISLYSFAQEIHNNFFATFFSVSKINIIGELPQVIKEVGLKIDLKSFYIFLGFILFLVFIKIFNNSNNTSMYRYRLSISFICILLFFVSLSLLNKRLENEVINDGWNNWNSDKYLRETFFSNKRYYDRFGIFDYIVNDIKQASKNDDGLELTDDERKEIDDYIYNANKEISTNEYTNIYKDKNLILILAESLNNYPIDKYVMPTLYKMANEGIYFDNFYAPLYQGSTSDSEFISQTSMVPSLSNGVTCYKYGGNSYDYALANLFKKNGYKTNSFHSSYAQYYNRESFHIALGFDVFYGIEALSIEYPAFFQQGQNWIKDSILFNYSLNRTDCKNKFYDFMISASGHMPYTYRDENDANLNKLNANAKYEKLNEETKHYLASQMNFDEGLSQLLADLETNNILNDTIIIIFGDHYPYGITDNEAIKEVIGDSLYGYEKYRVPFIIYDPSGQTESQINSKLGSSFDIYPTISNMFGLDNKGAYMLGSDLFDNKKHYVAFSDGSILADDFYYNSLNGSIDFFVSETSDYSQIIADTKRKFLIGTKVITYDYYAKKVNG